MKEEFDSPEKQQMLKYCPDAICVAILENNGRSGSWKIMNGEKRISISFQGEAVAWSYALLMTEQKFMELMTS